MGNHYEKKRKRKSSVIILISIVIIICILVGVLTCIYLANKQIKPEETVNKFFTALKDANKNQVNEYADYEKIIYMLDKMLVEENNTDIPLIEKKLFENIEWNIKDIKIEESKASLSIETTNKDFVEVVSVWMKKIIDEMENNKEITTNISISKIKEALNKTEKTKTVEGVIELNREEKKWKVKIDSNLRDLIYPGIDNVATVLQQDELNK